MSWIWIRQLIWSCFFLTAIVCFSGSAIYHLFFPQSISAVYWLGILDFTGTTRLHLGLLLCSDLTNELTERRYCRASAGKLLSASLLWILLLSLLATNLYILDLPPRHSDDHCTVVYILSLSTVVFFLFFTIKSSADVECADILWFVYVCMPWWP